MPDLMAWGVFIGFAFGLPMGALLLRMHQLVRDIRRGRETKPEKE